MSSFANGTSSRCLPSCKGGILYTKLHARKYLATVCFLSYVPANHVPSIRDDVTSKRAALCGLASQQFLTYIRLQLAAESVALPNNAYDVPCLVQTTWEAMPDSVTGENCW